MVAIRPGEVAKTIAKAASIPPLWLVYGPDRGLVNETAKPVVRAVAGEGDDPFALVSLTLEDLSADPSRLVDEARTISMFGGRRAVHLRDTGGKDLSAMVRPLTDDPPTDAVVVIEAGDLRKTAPLVKAWEKHPAAVVVACYPDTAADLDRLMDEEARAFGLSIDREAKEMLHALLGGDRLASRGEIVKLMLYARDEGTVEPHHVREIVGDVSAFGAQEAVDAAFLGDAPALERELHKLRFAGVHPSVVAGTGLRHTQALARAAVEVDRGTDPARAVKAMVPRVHFKRERAVTGMLSGWSLAALEQAARALDRAVLETRRRPHLAAECVSTTLHAICRRAPSARQRRRG